MSEWRKQTFLLTFCFLSSFETFLLPAVKTLTLIVFLQYTINYFFDESEWMWFMHAHMHCLIAATKFHAFQLFFSPSPTMQWLGSRFRRGPEQREELMMFRLTSFKSHTCRFVFESSDIIWPLNPVTLWTCNDAHVSTGHCFWHTLASSLSLLFN